MHKRSFAKGRSETGKRQGQWPLVGSALALGEEAVRWDESWTFAHMGITVAARVEEAKMFNKAATVAVIGGILCLFGPQGQRTAEAQGRTVQYCVGEWDTNRDCKAPNPFSNVVCAPLCTDHFKPGSYVHLACKSPPPDKIAEQQCGAGKYDVKYILMSVSGHQCGYDWYSVTCKP